MKNISIVELLLKRWGSDPTIIEQISRESAVGLIVYKSQFLIEDMPSEIVKMKGLYYRPTRKKIKSAHKELKKLKWATKAQK